VPGGHGLTDEHRLTRTFTDNGGKRGFLVEIAPQVLKELLPVTEITVSLPRS